MTSLHQECGLTLTDPTSGCHVVSGVVCCQIRMSGYMAAIYTGHSPNPHSNKCLSPPGIHPVVLVHARWLMRAHTHHNSALQHSLNGCTNCTSGVTHLTLSHTHTGYRKRERGEGVCMLLEHTAGSPE